ncbi:MAG TPA: hypothetical protein VLF59_05125 [Candidatus Saccharimonadales bacterium]|nr:hypothetical protein [Candidatus Saccharimonadales bacterium]
MKNTDSKWILAYRHDDYYAPETVYDTQEQAFANLEYEDVKRETYQLWEYPHGGIFLISPDREVAKSKEWSLASSGEWAPKLVPVGIDVLKVTEAYRNFQL